MNVRRLGTVLGMTLALVFVLAGVGPPRLTVAARAADESSTTTTEKPTTTTEKPTTSTSPPTTSCVGCHPPSTEKPPATTQTTQPDFSSDTTLRKSTTSTTRKGQHTTTTVSTDSTDTTESTIVAGLTDTTLSDETTVTRPPSTTPHVAARAVDASHHKSKTGLLAVLMGITAGGIALTGVGVRARRRRGVYEPAYQTMVLPPLFDDKAGPDPAPQPDWTPRWDADAGTDTTLPVAPVESARARRKRERRERFHAEHDEHVEPEEALAALAAWEPEPEPQAQPVPEPEPQPEPVPAPSPSPSARAAAADPYEDIDWSSATPEPGLPDMNIDMSGPEF